MEPDSEMATNVADAAVSVVTPIDLDHTELLGDTVELVNRALLDSVKLGALDAGSSRPGEGRTSFGNC